MRGRRLANRLAAWLCPALVLVLLQPVQPMKTPISKTRQEGLSSFFNAMDEDGDGQIQASEASRYLTETVGGESFDTPKEIRQGVAHFLEIVDSEDSGQAVSEAELERHLAQDRLMSAAAVERWVEHGLQLPQYAAAFRRNAITALDFPSLVTDPTSLAQDLGVRSSLHRTQISRALKWHILGVGLAPAAATHLTCQAVAGSKIVLEWRDPQLVGRPPFHSYALLRRSTPTQTWTTVTLGGEMDAYEDADVQHKQVYTYRLVLWGLYGDSPHAEVSGCRAGSGKSKSKPAKQPAVTETAGSEDGGWQGVYALFMSALLVMGPLLVRNEHLWAVAGMWLGAKPAPAPNASGVTPEELAAAEDADGRAAAAAAAMVATSGEETPGARTPWLSRSRSQLPERSPAVSGDARGVLRRPRSHQNLDGIIRVGPTTFLGGEQLRGSPRATSSLNATPREHLGAASPESGVVGRARRGSAGDRAGSDSGSDLGPLLTPASVRRHRVITNGHYRHYSSGSESEDFFQLIHTEAGDEAIEERVDTPPQHLQDVQRHRCAHEGCSARWDRWHKLKDVRTAFGRHYCRLCQLAYCQRHTRISPHGPHGSCGLESHCYCAPCFASLPPEVRAAVDATNKLVKPLPAADKGDKEKRKGGWPSLGQLRTAGLTKPAWPSLGQLRRNMSQSSMRSDTSRESRESDHDDVRSSPHAREREREADALPSQLPPRPPPHNGPPPQRAK